MTATQKYRKHTTTNMQYYIIQTRKYADVPIFSQDKTQSNSL